MFSIDIIMLISKSAVLVSFSVVAYRYRRNFSLQQHWRRGACYAKRAPELILGASRTSWHILMFRIGLTNRQQVQVATCSSVLKKTVFCKSFIRMTLFVPRHKSCKQQTCKVQTPAHFYTKVNAHKSRMACKFPNPERAFHLLLFLHVSRLHNWCTTV